MPPTPSSRDRGRALFEQRRWGDAYAALAEAGAGEALGGEIEVTNDGE